MTQFEYTAVPAPKRTKRIKGVRGQEARFAAIFAEAINEQAADGWEYVRTESLPVEEKRGVFGARREAYHNILIFRRATGAEAGFIDTAGAAIAAAPIVSAPSTETQKWIPEEPLLAAPVAASVAAPIAAPVIEETPVGYPAAASGVALTAMEEVALDELPPLSTRPAD